LWVLRIPERGRLSRSAPYPGHRKPRPDTPSLEDLRESVEPSPADRREGLWTRLDLLEMNERFAQAMRRAPEAPKGDGPDRVAEALLPPRRG
jgi:hypothetical protein